MGGLSETMAKGRPGGKRL